MLWRKTLVSAFLGSVSLHILLFLPAWVYIDYAAEQASPSFAAIAVGVVANSQGEHRSKTRSPQINLPLMRISTGGADRLAPDTSDQGSGKPAERPAKNLATRLAELSLDRATFNRPDLSQTHRVATSRERASRDPRRATPNPMQLSFLSSGVGTLRQRVKPRTNPARAATSLVYAGRRRYASAAPAADPATSAASRSDGKDHQPILRPHLPIERTDRVRRAREVSAEGAPVVRARPEVVRARAAVPAERVDRPHDTVDSNQAVARAVASLISASAPEGAQQAGPGGAAEGSSTGTDGSRVGSRSKHAGARGSSVVGPDPQEIQYYRYVRARLGALIQPSFPSSAVAEGRGGLAILSFKVKASGAVFAVRLVRPSGIPEYDRNLMARVKRLTLPPLPQPLKPGPLPIRYRFDGINPSVRRARR